MPKRIQRKRTKGWRMPAGAVYVGRPSKFGNPYDWQTNPYYRTRAACVEAYRYSLGAGLRAGIRALADGLEELRGKDLACWCPLDQPCHADVLLELANPAPPGQP